MRGGYRVGAGRPKGSKNRAKPLLPPRPPGGAIAKERIADVRQRAEAWLAEHEEPLLARIMAGTDLRLQFEALKFIKGYADGVAPRTIDLNIHADFEAAMREVNEQAERRQLEAVTVEVINDELRFSSVPPALPSKTDPPAACAFAG